MASPAFAVTFSGKRAALFAIVPAALLLLGLVVLRAWLLRPRSLATELIRNPQAKLEDEDVLALGRYIRKWESRRSGTEEEERELAKSVVENCVATGECFLLSRLAENWHDTCAFPCLPRLAADAANDLRPHAGEILITVSSFGKGSIDPYVDVPAVMSRAESQLVVAVILCLRMDTLEQNREACLGMLGRRDVNAPAKAALLGMVSEAGRGRVWFGGRTGLLDELALTGDPEIREVVEILRGQSRGAPARRQHN